MNYNLSKYPLNGPYLALSKNRSYRKKRRPKQLRLLLAAIVLSLMIVAIFYTFRSFSPKHKNNIGIGVTSNRCFSTSIY